ncbi:MAG: sterol desaturase family protein [bacterium]|nr:sterol desaturase family protein [bacterium]
MFFIVAILLSIAYVSLVEWLLHRFVMHQPLLGFSYPFEAHAKKHHRIFRADDSYHLKRDEDKYTIPMKWWNGPVLIFATTLTVVPIGWLIGRWSVVAIVGIVCAAYYGAYEYLHWCMHLPRKRLVERSGIFFRLNGHHLLHHRYMNRNFNVVLPLADLFLGTLLLRSKVRFAQAVGPSLPNVQPLTTQCRGAQTPVT